MAAAFLLGGLTVAFAISLRAERSNSKDPTVLAPGMYRVVLENEHLRVIDYHLKPGEKEPIHSHPKGVFVYYFTDAATRGNVENGESSERRNKAGDVVWRDPVMHIAENIGDAEIHELLVEPTSRLRSLTPQKAKEKRMVVLTPGNVSCIDLGLLVIRSRSTRRGCFSKVKL